MSWFEIVKETVEYSDFCCRLLYRDIKEYLIPHFSDRGYLSKDRFEHLFGKDCDEVLQTLEDIRIDGTMMFMNKKFGMRSWDTKVFNTGVLEDMQEVSIMILKNWEDCSLDEQTVEMSNKV
tara:strand:- start:276 stop:638 length:363 start_codon:yes stop_codon:yes gene_type:complete